MRSIAAMTFALASASFLGCGGGNALPTGPSPVVATVEFAYVAAAAVGDPAFASLLDCAGEVRLQPSWWGFAGASMFATAENTWAILFDDVPVGRQTIRIDAPEGCVASTVTANGTRLSSRVEIPAGGDAAFAFMVHPDGSVTP